MLLVEFVWCSVSSPQDKDSVCPERVVSVVFFCVVLLSAQGVCSLTSGIEILVLATKAGLI